LAEDSFAYPGGKSKDNAVNNILLKILVGALAVIEVDHNQAAEPWLNRLYDVASGGPLMDGPLIRNPRNADLRNVLATILTQDNPRGKYWLGPWKS
jgi:hypothetical protein